MLARAALPAAILLLLCAATLDWTHPLLYRGGFEAAALIGVILIAACRAPQANLVRRLLEQPLLMRLGAILLRHLSVAFPAALDRRGDPTQAAPAPLALALALSLGLAVASFHAVERPLLVWQRGSAGRHPRASPPLAPTAAAD